MKKKSGKIALATGLLLLTCASTAYAGQWKQDAKGYWWQEDNGSYPVNSWHWLDGNRDGVSECYYFDANGYMLANTTTPDGYQINGDGAWIANGVVQTRNARTEVKETDISEVPVAAKRSFLPFEAEETAFGSVWNNGYEIIDDGYAELELGKKYSELSMTAICGKANAVFADSEDEYILSFIGDDDTVLASYDMIDDIKKAKNIKVDVADQQYVTIRWSSETSSAFWVLMKNIKLR